jgi:hypothetical protein
VSSKPEPSERRVVGFLGVGLDNKDGHKRLTQSEHFLLVGGSEETHERMQETAIKFSENLRRRGQELTDIPVEEVVELLYEAKQS